MNTVVLSKTYPAPPFCEKEILRYAGCKYASEETRALLNDCLKEIKDKLIYQVCYCELPVQISGDICDLALFRVASEKLARNLKEAEKVILFAATVGIETDRLIAKYGRLSPAKALMFQAIGAERIEALCDVFCADIKEEYHTEALPRFSPGYGDVPLSVQKEIFAVLEPHKKIGLTLNNSFLMSPTKSVTAFLGLGGRQKPTLNKCSNCNNLNCTFRGVS